MNETFVDLLYRGLPLGRRIKLTKVATTSGYLEHPTPMPVGTAIAISTDDSVVVDAVVRGVHEQVGGSGDVPGMTVEPALGEDAAASWWKARVTEPDAPPEDKPKHTGPVTVRPRTHTVPEPVPSAVPKDAPTVPTESAAAVPEPVTAGEPDITLKTPALPADADDPRRTKIMPAVDQELLESLARDPAEIERLTRTTGEHQVVDDGKRTIVMDAIDPAALGLETSSNSLPQADDGDGDGDGDGNGGDSAPSGDKKPASKSRRKRKRR